MPRILLDVTVNKFDPAWVGSDLVKGGLILADLEARGTLKKAKEELKIRRQGGYAGVDIWIALLLFVGAGAKQGIKSFWELVVPHATRIAAVAGRKKLPSPSSISRALSSVECELLREAMPWMLMHAPDLDRLLRHPAVQSYGALGHRIDRNAIS